MRFASRFYPTVEANELDLYAAFSRLPAYKDPGDDEGGAWEDRRPWLWTASEFQRLRRSLHCADSWFQRCRGLLAQMQLQAVPGKHSSANAACERGQRSVSGTGMLSR